MFVTIGMKAYNVVSSTFLPLMKNEIKLPEFVVEIDDLIKCSNRQTTRYYLMCIYII